MVDLKRKRVKSAVIFLIIGALVNLGLAITKLYIGLRSTSVTIMLDATNNFFDILSCAVTVAAFSVLLKERADSVAFGYGRAEYIAGFVISLIVLITGGVFLYESLTRLAMPTPIWFSWSYFVVMAAAVLIKLALGFYYAGINRKLKSKAFSALTLDSFLDTAITATALISFTVSGMVDFAADAFFGIALSIVIIIFGLRSAVENTRLLLGNTANRELKSEIEDVLEGFSEIKETIRITLHDYGYKKNVGTAEVRLKDESISVSDAVKLTERIETEIADRTDAEISVVLKAED